LCVAIESYISQKANFFSDTILEKAIELLANGFDGSPNLTGAASSEILLAQGGCMTSLGAAISSTGPASLLALTIDSRFQVTSSLTAGILLPYVIEDVAKYKSDKLANVARIMRIADQTTDTKTAVNALSENIRNRLALANLPARLKDLSVSIEQLALAAEDAGQLDLINGLPRSMNADDLFDLIKQAY
jgi:alcohol dehydrogenase